MYQPLADLLRPQTLDEVYGQEHILGKGAVLRRLIDSGKVPNMVFYGPSGTGKTTVANIIAKQTNRTLYKLNATTASTADIKEIVSQLDTFMAPNGVLLYLDEIQSFNKKQQQGAPRTAICATCRFSSTLSCEKSCRPCGTWLMPSAARRSIGCSSRFCGG